MNAKKVIVCLFSLSAITHSVFPQLQEIITVTTYYPSPHGVYRDLETRRLVVGVDAMPTVDGVVNFQGLAGTPAWSNPGAMYYDSNLNQFMYWDPTSGAAGAWVSLGGTAGIVIGNPTGLPANTNCACAGGAWSLFAQEVGGLSIYTVPDPDIWAYSYTRSLSVAAGEITVVQVKACAGTQACPAGCSAVYTGMVAFRLYLGDASWEPNCRYARLAYCQCAY